MEKLQVLQIQEFKRFFTGSLHNFGEFIYDFENKSAGKINGKARSVVNQLITIKEYENHLNGKTGLGIIPITEENTCFFSVIDVDIYKANLSIYIKAIEKGGFPLIPFKSKSGGLHIYIFYKKGIPAKKSIEIMRKFSSILSIDNLVKANGGKRVEVFPKQSNILDTVGNWINLPYYNYSNTLQPAIKKGKELSLDEAIVYIKEKVTTIEEVEDFLKSLELNDAPPCLQQLYFLSPLLNRNNFLFSMGVYLKKKDEESFEQELLEINNGLIEPLEEKELTKTVTSSLKKRDYSYKCKEDPCVSYCNKTECKKREFGIGKNEGYFSSIEVGQLYQYKMQQPYYEWEVKLQGNEEIKRLRFNSEDEIIKQDTFLKLCMRELHELPNKLKQSEWFNKVNQSLKELKIITVDEYDDTSPIMILKAHIHEFLADRALADTKNQILSKRVYFDAQIEEYYFRSKDIMEYIFIHKQFKYFKVQELHAILREFKCFSKQIRLENKKQIRVMAIKKSDMDDYYIKEIFNPDFSESKDEGF